MLRPAERFHSLVRAPLTFWRVMARGHFDFDYDLMPVNVRGMTWAKRWNLLVAGTHLLRRQQSLRNMPLHMQIELTNFCNLHCPVCPTGIGDLHRAPQALDVDLYERLMREVGPYLLTQSLWGWGESLLHPRLGEFLRIARQYPIMTQVSTNGQNLNDPAVIAAMADHPPTYLIVALDGLSDETNSVFRAGAHLAPALEGVRRLAEIKRKRGDGSDLPQRPVLHMRFIVMRHNEHEVPRVAEFARDHGFDLLTMRTLSIIGAPEETHRKLLPETPADRAYDYDSDKRVQRNDYICTEPYWFPTLFADGTLVPCIHDYRADQPYGVLTADRTFRDVWFSEQATQVRRALAKGRQGFCASCPYADRCVDGVSVEATFFDPQARRCVV